LSQKTAYTACNNFSQIYENYILVAVLPTFIACIEGLDYYNFSHHCFASCHPADSMGVGEMQGLNPEPVFLNVYGAQESIPRHQIRQPM
jgi:hypothetical protein